MNHKKFILFFHCLILFLGCFILSSYLSSIIFGLILALGFYPLRKKIELHLKLSPSISNIVIFILASLIFLIPLAWAFILITQHFKSAETLSLHLLSYARTIEALSWVQDFKHKIPMALPDHFLSDLIIKIQHSISFSIVVDFFRTNVLSLLNQFLLTLLFFFLFLTHGILFLQKWIQSLPLHEESHQFLHFEFERQRQLFHSLFNGFFILGFVEGLCFISLYSIYHVPQSLFLGLLTGFSTAIPLLGPLFLFFSFALIALHQNFLESSIFISIGFLLIFIIDPLLRTTPSKKLHIDSFFLFLSIFFSMGVFGIPGLFLGPFILLFLQDLINHGSHLK